MSETHKQKPPRVEDRPSFWFLLLERFLDNGELEEAAKAQRKLASLGVDVRYRCRHRRPCRRGAAHVA